MLRRNAPGSPVKDIDDKKAPERGLLFVCASITVADKKGGTGLATSSAFCLWTPRTSRTVPSEQKASNKLKFHDNLRLSESFPCRCLRVAAAEYFILFQEPDGTWCAAPPKLPNFRARSGGPWQHTTSGDKQPFARP